MASPPGDELASDQPGGLTVLFDGRQVGTETLLPLLYKDLRELAAVLFREERPDQTLQPTALVHEAFVRLVDQKAAWQNKAHFFAVAALSMRRVLKDAAKARRADKRGGGHCRVTLVDQAAEEDALHIDLLDLEAALEQMSRVNERLSKVVELHVLGGLTLGQTAEALGVSRWLVVQEWAKARALLECYVANGESGA